MIKKLLILISMFIFFQIGFSKIDMKSWNEYREELLKSNITVENAYQELVDAQSIGYDYYDIYLNILLKEKNSEELLEKAFYDSKYNAGKIFILQGMYKVNNKKYQNMKKELRGKVSLDYGCFNEEEDVNKYLEKLELHLNL